MIDALKTAQRQEPIRDLSQVSFYGTGGGAHEIYSVHNLDEFCDKLASPGEYYFLGGGTNSLVIDEDYPGTVYLFHKLSTMRREGNVIIAGAGVDNSSLALFARDQGLGGLSWMYGLPGQVGATTRMNAKCYGGEISQVVCKVICATAQGLKTYEGSEATFRGYKDTVFMDSGEPIVEVWFQTTGPAPADRLTDQMEACYADRKAKHQYDFPSCGCVFKNDYRVGVPSGMLLEAAGVRNLRHERLVVNPAHANFVFNLGGATSGDILRFTALMREAVYDRYGVWLAYEMEVLGHLPDDLRDIYSEQRESEINESRIAPLRAKFQERQVSS